MADLIEREPLLEKMFPSQQKRLVEEAPAVNRWIPCSERMPENNVSVLYVWRSQNGAVAVLHGWHFETRVTGSAWHQSGVGFHRPDDEVTHWMPLPEPPKEDET